MLQQLMVDHLITANRVVIIRGVMGVTIPVGHVNVVDKKIVMLHLLFRMNVTAMCRVLRQVVVEQDQLVLKGEELDQLVLKGEELDLLEKQGLLDLLVFKVKQDLLDIQVFKELLEFKGKKVILVLQAFKDLQDL